MKKYYKYTVADHTFAVSLPDGYVQEDYLKPYLPFKSTDDAAPLFRLTLDFADSLEDVNPGKLCTCLNEEAPYFWIFENPEGRYNFGFSYSKSQPDCIVVTSPDLSDNIVYIPVSAGRQLVEFALNNALMLLYTFNTTPYETLMVHASVVAHGAGAYMFLGRSGTGKSTHSALWLNNISDTVLLNDDNPVIRIKGEEVFIYGSPWSGKTPCYKNEFFPLKASVRLSQSKENCISKLAPLQSYASLMPACSCMRWDRRSTDALHKTVEKVISKVGSWHLECLPDAEAAILCHSTVTSR